MTKLAAKIANLAPKASAMLSLTLFRWTECEGSLWPASSMSESNCANVPGAAGTAAGTAARAADLLVLLYAIF